MLLLSPLPSLLPQPEVSPPWPSRRRPALAAPPAPAHGPTAVIVVVVVVVVVALALALRRVRTCRCWESMRVFVAPRGGGGENDALVGLLEQQQIVRHKTKEGRHHGAWLRIVFFGIFRVRQ